MKSEYNNLSGSAYAEYFDADTYDKSDAMNSYKSEFKRFKKIVKEYDFEYLPERR